MERGIRDGLETIDRQAIGPVSDNHHGLNVRKALDDFHLSIDGERPTFPQVHLANPRIDHYHLRSFPCFGEFDPGRGPTLVHAASSWRDFNSPLFRTPSCPRSGPQYFARGSKWSTWSTRLSPRRIAPWRGSCFLIHVSGPPSLTSMAPSAGQKASPGRPKAVCALRLSVPSKRWWTT